MALVRSGGELVAVGRGETLSIPRAISLPGGSSATYEALWRAQPQVRTVVSFLGRNIAQLGIHVFRRISDDERERLADHPLAQTLSAPNPDTTRYEFVDALVQDLGIFDNAYLLKLRAESGRVALVRLPPRKVTPVGDNWLTPEGYELTGSRGKVTYSAEQVIHFRGYNPTDPRVGVSPLETLRRILAEEAAAADYREQFWRNGARVSGYIKRPESAPAWSAGARARFLAEWRALYAFDGPQAGGTPLLEDGMSIEAASYSAEQAQYIEARKLTREEVAAAFHIPLPMVGILEHATFSNIAEQHKQLYQDTLGPWLQLITQRLELRLLPEYADTDRVYVEFNLAEKLRGSFEEQAAQLQTAVGAPWLTRNEARARQNLPPIDGGDELVTPLNVLTGGQASPTDADTSDVPKALIRGGKRRSGVASVQVKASAKRWDAKYREVLEAHFRRQGQSVASRLGGAKARGKASLDDVFDAARWDRELAADLYTVNADAALAAARDVLDAAGADPADFDPDVTLAWLKANAEGVAHGVNATTADQLEAALVNAEDPPSAVAHVFEVAVAARAAQVAVTQATAMRGFGGREGARSAGLTHKTWRVTSSRPRSSHSRLDGDTVRIGERFANGGRWPGDSNLDDDERSGCTCDVTFHSEES